MKLPQQVPSIIRKNSTSSSRFLILHGINPAAVSCKSDNGDHSCSCSSKCCKGENWCDCDDNC